MALTEEQRADIERLWDEGFDEHGSIWGDIIPWSYYDANTIDSGLPYEAQFNWALIETSAAHDELRDDRIY